MISANITIIKINFNIYIIYNIRNKISKVCIIFLGEAYKNNNTYLKLPSEEILEIVIDEAGRLGPVIAVAVCMPYNFDDCCYSDILS